MEKGEPATGDIGCRWRLRYRGRPLWSSLRRHRQRSSSRSCGCGDVSGGLGEGDSSREDDKTKGECAGPDSASHWRLLRAMLPAVDRCVWGPRFSQGLRRPQHDWPTGEIPGCWLGLPWGDGVKLGLQNEKIETQKPARVSGLLDVNAGDYLISHTLSRAVPSARRGLTSVFGMGTGVTLAVCSPASCDATPGGSFPTAISLHTRAVSPRNENGKLAPQTCICTNCIGRAFTALKACC